MDCINLQEQFGQQYRITFDPAYNPKHVPRDKLDAWMMLIPCRRGVIYPHGGDLLIVEVDGRRVTANRLATWTAPRRIKRATSFLAVTFDVADFDEVAAIVKPKRHRQVSEAERQRLATIGATTRFDSRQPEHVQRPVRRSETSA